MNTNLKLCFSFSLILVCMDICLAQKHDNIWLSGYARNQPVNKFDFSAALVSLGSVNAGLYSELSIYSMSDARGKLLFYSNGLEVFDASFQLMENGDSLHEIDVTSNGFFNFLFVDQAMVVLPDPADSLRYYIIHPLIERDFINVFPFFIDYIKELRFSLVDMRLDGGLGALVEKRQTIIRDKKMMYGGLTACKHANGKSWWVIIPGLDQGDYHSVLVDSTGVSYQSESHIEMPGEQPFYGKNFFSPNGKTYARFHNLQLDPILKRIDFYDFDRCTGKLENYRSFELTLDPKSGVFVPGCEFSPNSKFLFVNDGSNVFQYEMNSNDFLASRILVGKDPNSTFGAMELTPEGRIFIFDYRGGGRKIHVIHNPNGKGLSSDLQLNVYSPDNMLGNSTPNFPNYRLGAIPEPCAPIVGTTDLQPVKPGNLMTVFPNPANQFFQFETPFGPPLHQFYLTDHTGKIVLQHENLTKDSEISIEFLPSGLYFIRATDTKGNRLTGKVTVLR